MGYLQPSPPVTLQRRLTPSLVCLVVDELQTHPPQGLCPCTLQEVAPERRTTPVKGQRVGGGHRWDGRNSSWEGSISCRGRPSPAPVTGVPSAVLNMRMAL